jgi:hypothetical protein
MEVILLEKLDNLGGLGEKVSVKSGFGRNFLIPKGKAVFASSENVRLFEERRAELEQQAAEKLAAAAARKAQIEGLSQGRRRRSPVWLRRHRRYRARLQRGRRRDREIGGPSTRGPFPRGRRLHGDPASAQRRRRCPQSRDCRRGIRPRARSDSALTAARPRAGFFIAALRAAHAGRLVV